MRRGGACDGRCGWGLVGWGIRGWDAGRLRRWGGAYVGWCCVCCRRRHVLCLMVGWLLMRRRRAYDRWGCGYRFVGWESRGLVGRLRMGWRGVCGCRFVGWEVWGGVGRLCRRDRRIGCWDCAEEGGGDSFGGGGGFAGSVQAGVGTSAACSADETRSGGVEAGYRSRRNGVRGRHGAVGDRLRLILRVGCPVSRSGPVRRRQFVVGVAVGTGRHEIVNHVLMVPPLS
jgi:hypothetical protein